jgi:hypothetical protein
MAESRARWRFTAGDFFSSHRLERQPLDERTREQRQMKKNQRREKTAARIFFFFFLFQHKYMYETNIP